MSTQYPGGFITKSPVAPTSSAASGIWTVDQALQYVKAGTWPAQPVNYIEDMFSTYLYTGTGTATTIVNGINISTNGGLVWIKQRNSTFGHYLTYPGLDNGSQQGYISSDTTSAASYNSTGLTAFNTNGFTVDSNGQTNAASSTYVSWTFREQPKFFDIATGTTNGSGSVTITHNLGSVPGCVFFKQTALDGGTNWCVYHRSTGSATTYLNLTNASDGGTRYTNITSTTITCSGLLDANQPIIAFLFAHDAGGFGLTGSDNVISCGSFTTDVGGNATVSLGYEPQWLMVKTTAVTGSWFIVDNMRGMPVGGAAASLYPNLTNVESLGNTYSPSATGFNYAGTASEPFIYIAIRRGPMKVPTVGTSVFTPLTYTGTSSQATRTPGISSDLFMSGIRADATGLSLGGFVMADKLRGWGTFAGASTVLLGPYSTSSEQIRGQIINGVSEQNSITLGSDNSASPFNYSVNYSGSNYIEYFFRRAPSFFDEVCYTGTGPTSQALTHNLGVQPTLIIVKARDLAGQEWAVQINGDGTKLLKLNSTAAIVTNNAYWNDTNPTSTTFTVGPNAGLTNNSGTTYVAYLFATCAGVSKVGSYTGTAATLQIDCGFTAGSRFVLIKRTDSTGDWYVWDSARGIIAGNDPYLLLNNTDAEVTGTDYVDTYNAGFELTSTAPAALNASGGTYIFLAIA